MWILKNKKDKTQQLFPEQAQTALQQLFDRKDIGFFNTNERRKELVKIQNLADQKRKSYKQIAVLGIGGSALGTIALFESCKPDWIREEKIIFFDNVDAASFFKKLNSIQKPLETLWVLVSKSGGTIETLTQSECIDQYLREKFNTDLAQNSVVITESKPSDLYNWAKENGVDTLDVPRDVGGRFSVLSAVGLFPAAFAEMDLQRLLDGAEKAKAAEELLVYTFNEHLASFKNSAQAAYFFSYADNLTSFGLWLEQLWAESLGKKFKDNGEPAPVVPVPIACRGATDQHSVLQQVAHGAQKKTVTFLRVGESEHASKTLTKVSFKSTEVLLGKSIGELLKAEATATDQALQEENIPTMSLFTERLDEESMGFLFMFYQIVVATLGLSQGLNPFDQPGVERGKVLARDILAQKNVKL